jgi:serine/threonine protein phosphatase PrpC
MPERFSDSSPERRQIHNEILNLEEGPIDIELGPQHLRIVDPARDLGQDDWSADYLVIDPLTYDPEKKQGYKGLWEDEDVTLGRSHTYGRFDFPDHVSREHVLLSIRGSKLHVTDLNSTNGTYVYSPSVRESRTTRGPERRPVRYEGIIEVAGQSVASDLHPERNEDSFFINETKGAIGVFDGAGGVPGSELASQLASEAAAEYLKRVQSDLPRNLSQLAMYEALYSGHEAILNDSRAERIATTATIAKVFETERGITYAVVASVGDSRAYLYRDGSIAHLTLDQAYRTPGYDGKDKMLLQMTLSEATDLSRLSDSERNAFRRRHILTSCLGRTDIEPVITVNDFEVRPGDKLVITSDGIHDNLTNSEIEKILSDNDSADLSTRALVQAARQRSNDRTHVRAKPDDMTAVALTLL